MRAIAAAAALLTRINAEEYLEPRVQRHVGVLPPSVCQKLIDLGEKAGFLVREESIDEDEQRDPTKKYVPSQTIDVYEKAGYEPDEDGEHNGEEFVDAPDIWGTLQPWIPKIAQIVKDNRDKEGFKKYYPNDPDREPELNWIFFRKYSPEDERNSLKLHHDTNMNTVNIALNDDYVGGGLFYLKPKAATAKDGLDDVPEEYQEYQWIDTVKKENATDIVFPDLHTGDAIFYNYTVEHAVAPVESGTRYSMAFFFDMDNPAVKEDFEDEDDDDEEDSEDGYDDWEVELRNELDVDLDIVRVHQAGSSGEVLRNVFHNVTRNETVFYYAEEGDKLRAFVAGTDEVLTDFKIKRGKPRYILRKKGKDKRDGKQGEKHRVPLAAAAAMRTEL